VAEPQSEPVVETIIEALADAVTEPAPETLAEVVVAVVEALVEPTTVTEPVVEVDINPLLEPCEGPTPEQMEEIEAQLEPTPVVVVEPMNPTIVTKPVPVQTIPWQMRGEQLAEELQGKVLELQHNVVKKLGIIDPANELLLLARVFTLNHKLHDADGSPTKTSFADRRFDCMAMLRNVRSEDAAHAAQEFAKIGFLRPLANTFNALSVAIASFVPIAQQFGLLRDRVATKTGWTPEQIGVVEFLLENAATYDRSLLEALCLGPAEFHLAAKALNGLCATLAAALIVPGVNDEGALATAKTVAAPKTPKTVTALASSEAASQENLMSNHARKTARNAARIAKNETKAAIKVEPVTEPTAPVAVVETKPVTETIPAPEAPVTEEVPVTEPTVETETVTETIPAPEAPVTEEVPVTEPTVVPTVETETVNPAVIETTKPEEVPVTEKKDEKKPGWFDTFSIWEKIDDAVETTMDWLSLQVSRMEYNIKPASSKKIEAMQKLILECAEGAPEMTKEQKEAQTKVLNAKKAAYKAEKAYLKAQHKEIELAEVKKPDAAAQKKAIEATTKARDEAAKAKAELKKVEMDTKVIEARLEAGKLLKPVSELGSALAARIDATIGTPEAPNSFNAEDSLRLTMLMMAAAHRRGNGIGSVTPDQKVFEDSLCFETLKGYEKADEAGKKAIVAAAFRKCQLEAPTTPVELLKAFVTDAGNRKHNKRQTAGNFDFAATRAYAGMARAAISGMVNTYRDEAMKTTRVVRAASVEAYAKAETPEAKAELCRRLGNKETVGEAVFGDAYNVHVALAIWAHGLSRTAASTSLTTTVVYTGVAMVLAAAAFVVGAIYWSSTAPRTLWFFIKSLGMHISRLWASDKAARKADAQEAMKGCGEALAAAVAMPLMGLIGACTPSPVKEEKPTVAARMAEACAASETDGKVAAATKWIGRQVANYAVRPTLWAAKKALEGAMWSGRMIGTGLAIGARFVGMGIAKAFAWAGLVANDDVETPSAVTAVPAAAAAA
jgi:hypothetical protein